MVFLVTVRTSEGDRLSFRREAKSTAKLALGLKREGMLLIAAEEVKAEERRSTRWHPGWLVPMTSLDAEMGLRQLASMLRSGVPILSALECVEEQGRTLRERRMWAAVRAEIAAGSTFAQAISRYERLFGPVTTVLVEVGERTGELDRALTRSAEQMEGRRTLKSTVVNALAYPLIAIAMAIGVSVFLVMSVIPEISQFLRAGGAVLPPLTQMLVDIADWFVANGAFALAATFAVLVSWFVGSMFSVTREAEDIVKLRIPIAGKILRLSATSLFARSMEIMLGSGVTLLEAMSVAARLLANRRCRRRIIESREAVIHGAALGASLKGAKEFMPMLASMAAVGERTGSLAEAFDEAAHLHELMLATAIKRFSVLIEPVMIGITGGIVGFVYIAFFMALFAMSAATG